ncbi:thiamine biosynthesis protein ApbE [Novosphingobium sp. Leaf2]|nr:thiamine biosynthesis protein ApbE [Novosphingobium sp. Leaf2]
MGTTWRVNLASPPGFDAGVLYAAITVRLAEIVAQMSHWQADSALGCFNRAAAGAEFAIAPDFATVMEAALSVATRSGGAFDPAIGAIVDLWGHGPVRVHRVPTPNELAAAMQASGFRRLAYDPVRRMLRQPGGLRLDLSGIAKGFAVDALAALLRGHGCHHALVEIGGELVGMGLKPDGDPWWVDLETPVAGLPPLRLALHQCAVATSGDYVRGCHTIDPLTGLPVTHAASVSVVHDCAMLADAWATALGAAPPAAMQIIATREKLCVRALIRDTGVVREWISPALAALIEPAAAV